MKQPQKSQPAGSCLSRELGEVVAEVRLLAAARDGVAAEQGQLEGEVEACTQLLTLLGSVALFLLLQRCR